MKAAITATDTEIVEFIRILKTSLGGVKNEVTDSTFPVLRKLYDSKKFSECIKEIKEIFKLKITLRIGYINSHSGPESLRKLVLNSTREMGLEDYQLKSALRQDLSCSAAFILQPHQLPAYGTPEFERLKLLMFLSKKVIELSFETFAYSIAHELSHVVLGAIRHPLRFNEVAVDLTAMILGFSEIIKADRKNKSFTCGYFRDDAQFQLAYDEIRKIRNVIYL